MVATTKHPTTPTKPGAPRFSKPAPRGRKVAAARRATPPATAGHHPQRRAADRLALDPAKLHAGIMQAIAGAMVPTAAPQPVPAPAPLAQPAGPPVAPAPALAAGTMRNGLRYPDTGTVSERLWTLYSAAPQGLTVAGARELAKHARLNEHSAVIAFYNWRKFFAVPKS